MIITIDGYSGAGKTTLARNLGNDLGFTVVEAGYIVRLLASRFPGRSPTREQVLAEFGHINLGDLASVQEYDIDNRMGANNIADSPYIQEIIAAALTNICRSEGNIIVVGRNIGDLVVAPDTVRFFLKVNASTGLYRKLSAFEKRREHGHSVERSLRKMEERDSLRAKRHSLAVEIDTTELAIAEVASIALRKLRQSGVGPVNQR